MKLTSRLVLPKRNPPITAFYIGTIKVAEVYRTLDKTGKDWLFSLTFLDETIGKFRSQTAAYEFLKKRLDEEAPDNVEGQPIPGDDELPGE